MILPDWNKIIFVNDSFDFYHYKTKTNYILLYIDFKKITFFLLNIVVGIKINNIIYILINKNFIYEVMNRGVKTFLHIFYLVKKLKLTQFIILLMK